MTAKEYLCKVLEAEKEIKVLKAQRAHYLDLATDTSADPDRLYRCGVGSAVAARSDLLKQIEERLKEYTRLQNEAEKLIDRIPQASQRQVLRLRYLCGMDWENVAQTMGYAVRHVHRIHGQALLSLNVT